MFVSLGGTVCRTEADPNRVCGAVQMLTCPVCSVQLLLLRFGPGFIRLLLVLSSYKSHNKKIVSSR